MSKSKKKKIKQQDQEPTLFYDTLGEEVSPGTAYGQAASLLDIAAVFAVESNDIESMSTVAHAWLEMAVLMQGEHVEVEDSEKEITKTSILGFGPTKTREVAEKDARKS